MQQHVNILLSDGKTRLSAALTQQSADRLQLSAGKEVLALIKAPWVKLVTDQALVGAADNSLRGTVASIEPGHDHSEVIVTLAGGVSLCSTQNNRELHNLNLRAGSDVIAQFNADRVIIATLC